MVGDLGLEVSDCHITQCIRLGKVRSQGPRLVKVRLPTEDAVMKVIKVASRLKEADDDRKNVFIFRDKSKEDRKIEKDLLNEAQNCNQDETDEDMMWKVDFKNKRVVRIRKGNVDRPRPGSGSNQSFHGLNHAYNWL